MRVEILNPHFRPRTQTEMRDVIFKFTMPGWKHAALGDQIAWLPAIVYVAEQYNFVKGHLVCAPWFVDVAKEVLSSYPHWRVYSDVPDHLGDGVPIFEMKGEIPNAAVMPLVDLGFIRFGGIYPVPEGAGVYPKLELGNIRLHEDVENEKRYAVLTTGSTAPTRRMEAHTYNGIAKHLLERGVTPVHVGTTSMNDGKRKIHIDSGYDLTLGINLINRTESLVHTAKLLEQAEMVIGIDNGLLHLAALTDVTILYGFTMVGPNHRRIQRPYGHTYELYGDKEKLPCLFCQENVRFFFGHNFEECLYKLNVPDCVKMLNLPSWTATIDLVLKGEEGES